MSRKLMKQTLIEEDVLILENKCIADDVYKMTLKSKNSHLLNAGQFVNLKIRNFYLKRPISVCEVGSESFTIIYKIFGDGTKELSHYKANEKITINLPLGNGFKIHKELKQVLLIGGGVGVPPLYELAKQYTNLGVETVAVLGFRSKGDVFLEDEFRNLGVSTFIATDDGSYGFHGNVLSLIKEKDINIDFAYAVGPKPMLKAVQNAFKKGYISLEERTGCGFGACMGCVCKDKDGNSYRVCYEGPVFEMGKVVL